MDSVIQLASATLGSLGFAALFNLRGKKLLLAALGGLIAWSVYLITERFTPNSYACAFAGSVVLTIYAEIMARTQRAPATVFLVIAAVPLIPGASLYRTADTLMQGLPERAAGLGMHTLLFAASMSAGITITSLVVRMLLNFLVHRKKQMTSR